MISLVEKVIDAALRVPRARRTRRELARLGEVEGAEPKWLWGALLDTLNDDLTSDERAWIERIEGMRQELRSSSTSVTRMDYGARDPGHRLSDEMMNRGAAVTATIGEICQTASNPYRAALLLFKLIRAFKPQTCLELGTSLGITAAYQAAALTLNGAGQLVTLEGADTIASLAAQHLRGLGLTNVTVVVGRFQDTLEGVLRDHRPIDFAFVDGHHDGPATLRYFQQIHPALSPWALVVFDDIDWSPGMREAWKTITEHSAVTMAIDLAAMGVCVIDQSHARRPLVRWSIL
jgi:predicted O-methyltransferase YrrM